MPLVIIYLFFNLIFTNLVFAENSNNYYSCAWDNKNTIPCLEVISLTPNSSNFSKSGINKIIISKKQIEQIGAVDLIDVLKTVTDFNITQSGPKGQQASIFMRGTGSNHTLVMINGIPINDQSTTQGLHDFGVDFIQTIQQIEIYPGSSATHFGTNAIGGAVNIILTGDYKNTFLITTDKSANYELSINKSYIYDESSLNIKVGSVKNETISARGDSKAEKDSLNNYSTNINYEKFLNQNLRVYNSIYLRQTKVEYDNSDRDQIGYEGDNKMGFIQFYLENQTKIKKNNYILYYNIYDRKYNELEIIDTYQSEVLGLKYDVSKIINEQLSFGLGSEYKYDWGYFNNNGLYKASTRGNTDNLAIYSNLGWNIFQNLNISLFARSDFHKQTKNNNTYKLNLEKKFNKFNLGLSYMNGLRNPTLYEMFGTDNFGYSGNRDLKAEKSNTFEIYSKISFNENLNLSLRAFKSNIQDNIEYIDNKYQNDSDNIDLNQSGLSNNLNLSFKNTSIDISSSFLSSKKENGASQLRRPEKNYSLNFSKIINNNLFSDLNINLNYNHYGKHFDTHSTDFNIIEMDSTDLVDVKVSKKLNNSDLYIKVTNVLNESYQRPHGFNQENRIFKFGIKY